ncbi:MAG: sigma-70 family RNA polymerase sigma factor [Actinomycetota bacterium]|nr:sigma-70 family RNA polymerase sigma factor [Actinomycetota bacterium]
MAAPAVQPPSTRATADRRLFERLHDPHDPVDADAVAERFLPLARSVARRHTSRGQSFDDVFQVACLALVKAIGRYDTTRSVAFSSYAVPTMIGEVKRYYRDRTWAVRPPRDLQERVLRVERALDDATARDEKTPTARDLARLLGIAEDDVQTALEAREARSAASLDLPARTSGRAALRDSVGRPDGRLETIEQRLLLHGLMKILTERERDIVWLRYEGDLTQAQIGREVGLSQMQVSRILSGAVHRLQIVARSSARLGEIDRG